jgi:hypothetical protein
MNAPQFQPGQNAILTTGNDAVPVHVFGREPGEHTRRYPNAAWVYHVVPAGCDCGFDVPEDVLQATGRPEETARQNAPQ